MLSSGLKKLEQRLKNQQMPSREREDVENKRARLVQQLGALKKRETAADRVAKKKEKEKAERKAKAKKQRQLLDRLKGGGKAEHVKRKTKAQAYSRSKARADKAEKQGR